MLNKSELMDMLHNLSKEHKVPAIQVGIIKDREIIFSGGAGFRDSDKKIESNEETIFAIGSTTKAIVATAVAILVDDGRIEWDKPVKSYIPEFEMYDSYVTENLTPRDILCHRSGLPRHEFMWLLNTENYSIEDMMGKLKYLKPAAPFRYEFRYQNHMFALAGYLIERVSGQKWTEFVHDRILVPLGMNDTNFSVEDSKKLENKALPYRLIDETIKEIPFNKIGAIGAAGAINSNIKDMLKWVQLNLDKGQCGDKTIISKKNIEECHAPQMVIRGSIFDEIEFASYGFGWSVESYKGHKIIHHNGSIDGFCSLVSFIPEINAGFVILTNRDGHIAYNIIQFLLYDMLFNFNKTDWNERYKTLLEKAESEFKEEINKIRNSAPKNTKPSLELQDYTGEYENNAYGKILIYTKNNSLMLKTGNIDVELEHLCFDSFILEVKDRFLVVPLQFNIDVTGKLTGVGVHFEQTLTEMTQYTKIK